MAAGCNLMAAFGMMTNYRFPPHAVVRWLRFECPLGVRSSHADCSAARQQRKLGRLTRQVRYS